MSDGGGWAEQGTGDSDFVTSNPVTPPPPAPRNPEPAPLPAQPVAQPPAPASVPTPVPAVPNVPAGPPAGPPGRKSWTTSQVVAAVVAAVVLVGLGVGGALLATKGKSGTGPQASPQQAAATASQAPAPATSAPAVSAPTAAPQPVTGKCWSGATIHTGGRCDVSSLGAQFAAFGFARSACTQGDLNDPHVRPGTSYQCLAWGSEFHVAQYASQAERDQWIAGYYGRGSCRYQVRTSSEICGPSKAGRLVLTYVPKVGALVYVSSPHLRGLQRIQARMWTGSQFLCGRPVVGGCWSD